MAIDDIARAMANKAISPNEYSVIVYAENNTTAGSGGWEVPDLTANQILSLYNGVVQGKNCIVTDKDGKMHFVVTQADLVGDSINIGVMYFDTMYMTYVLTNNSVVIETKEFD